MYYRRTTHLGSMTSPVTDSRVPPLGSLGPSPRSPLWGIPPGPEGSKSDISAQIHIIFPHSGQKKKCMSNLSPTNCKFGWGFPGKGRRAWWQKSQTTHNFKKGKCLPRAGISEKPQFRGDKAHNKMHKDHSKVPQPSVGTQRRDWQDECKDLRSTAHIRSVIKYAKTDQFENCLTSKWTQA